MKVEKRERGEGRRRKDGGISVMKRKERRGWQEGAGINRAIE